MPRLRPGRPHSSPATRAAVLISAAVFGILMLAPPPASAAPTIWTSPVPLNNAGSESGSDLRPSLTTDGAGNWVAVWQSTEDLGGTIGTDNDIFIARSSDNGATWTAPVALNANAASDAGSDEVPIVLTDRDGVWITVWRSNDSLGGTIGTDLDILFARSTNNGATWTPPTALNSNAVSDSGSDQGVSLATDENGNWIATWLSNENLGGSIGTDFDIFVARSSNDGALWSAPAALNTNASTDTGEDSFGSVATDRVGNWVAVWRSSDTLGGTVGTDFDIFVARSTNNGLTWSAPAPLNSSAPTDLGSDFMARLGTDANGNWVTVWASDDALGGTIGTDSDILVARSSDNGASWTDAAALNTNATLDSGDDDGPVVATNATGNWVTVWRSTDSLGGTIGTDSDILVARSSDTAVTWSSAAPLHPASGDSGDDLGPSLTTDGAGNWVAVWLSNENLGGTIGTDNDIFVARSSDNGATWTTPVALNTNAASDSGSDEDPFILTDRDGVWITVWHSTDSLGGTIGTDQDILFARSTNNGATWTAPTALNSNAASDLGFDRRVRLATDENGNWIATWLSNESLGGSIGTDFDIFVARSTSGGGVGSWSAPAALNTNASSDTGDDFLPGIATDRVGNWVAVWPSTENLGGTVGADLDIFVARSANNGLTWSAPVALNSNAAVDSGADQNPVIATDATGNWVAVWESTDTLGGAVGIDTDIFVARSANNGLTWSTTTFLNSNAPSTLSTDAIAHIATDAAGNWVTVWGSNGSLGGTVGDDFDILVARSSDNGASWTDAAALNTNAAVDSGLDLNPVVATDATGNWITVWGSTDTLGGTVGIDTDIFVARSSDTDFDNDGLPNNVDNCPTVANPSQANNDRNFIDHSPPFSPSVDDKTRAMSDGLGDACDNDDDNDGISDTDEASGAACGGIVTNPLLADTDGDRFLDGAECALGANPASAASSPLVTNCGPAGDSDGDKLSDRIEFCFYGTNPNNTDSDGDKAIDGGTDGCEAASFNGDRIVNVADMGMLASAIGNIALRHVNVDVNKDGVWNAADQGLVASFISPAGQCPG